MTSCQLVEYGIKDSELSKLLGRNDDYWLARIDLLKSYYKL